MRSDGDGELQLGTVLRNALAIFRAEWATIAAATLLAVIPAAIAQGALRGLAERTADDAWLAQAVLNAAFVGVGALGYFFVCGVVAKIVLERRGLGHRAGLGELARTLPYGSLIAVDLMVSTGVAVGIELLLIPGVIFGTWFALAPALIETRHLRPLEAMRRSRELVRGAFLPTLALLAIALGLVAGMALVLERLVGTVISGPTELQHAVAALLAAITVKPFAAVATVELTIELDARAGV